MAMMKVRLVTPTRRNTPSITAFEDELLNYFGWGEDLDYDVYAANDDLTGALPTLVNKAATETPAPDVIVSAGLMATNLLRTATSVNLIPVIQAAGGDAPTPQANITGFKLNALTTANNHLKTFKGAGRTVTVLYNDNNTTSANVYSSLTVPHNVTLNAPLRIHDPTALAPLPGAIDGFMVIPDAMFYKYHRKVAAMVEGKASQICYPERQFKNAHESKVHVKVIGYHVPATFRLAAGYVNRILNGDTVATLPGFADAVADNDPP